MDLDEKCQEVMNSRKWSQRQLAEALGVSDKNLISMRKGRRPMPTHALIKLERLRGADDHSIIEQLLKTAACVALAIVLIFWTGEKNTAMASNAYAAQTQHDAHYHAFWGRIRRALTAAFKVLAGTLGRWAVLRPA